MILSKRSLIILALIAGVSCASASGPDIEFSGSGNSVYVGVSTEFSTWSDITAIFRPSRWKNPFRPGGPLSFLNIECWLTCPGRTAKTFVGTAVVAGGIAAIVSSNGGDGGGAAAPEPAPQPTGGGGGNGDDGGAAAPQPAPQPSGGNGSQESDPGGWVESE